MFTEVKRTRKKRRKERVSECRQRIEECLCQLFGRTLKECCQNADDNKRVNTWSRVFSSLIFYIDCIGEIADI